MYLVHQEEKDYLLELARLLLSTQDGQVKVESDIENPLDLFPYDSR